MKLFLLCTMLLIVALPSDSRASSRDDAPPSVKPALWAKLNKADQKKPAGGITFELTVAVKDADAELPPSMPKAERLKRMAAAHHDSIRSVERLIGRLRDEGHFIQVDDTLDSAGTLMIVSDPKPAKILSKCKDVQSMSEKK